MANTFFRKPIIGADDHSWAPFNDAFIKDAIGNYSSYLYDDSGILKVAKGRIGISDGTNLGISIVDTITTIDLSSVSNSYWAKIEMSVSGTAVTFSAANITGETDPSSIPAVFETAWDGEKNGYYISMNKRLIGVVWKNSSGTLDGVVNVRGNDNGYIGSSVDDSPGSPIIADTAEYLWDKEKGVIKTGKPWGTPYNVAILKTKTGGAMGPFTAGSQTQDQVYNTFASIVQDGTWTICNGPFDISVDPSGVQYICGMRKRTDLVAIEVAYVRSGTAVFNYAFAFSGVGATFTGGYHFMMQ